MIAQPEPSIILQANFPRSMSRTLWKAIHRMARVSARESAKAATDMAIYGSGCVFYPADGSDPQYMPIGQVLQ